MPPPSKRLGRKETVPLWTAPSISCSAQPVVVPRSSARRAPGGAVVPIADALASRSATGRRVEAMEVSVNGSMAMGSMAMTAVGAGRIGCRLGNRDRPLRSRPSSSLARLGCDCGRALVASGWRITAPPSANRGCGDVAMRPRNIPMHIPRKFPRPNNGFGDVGEVGDVFRPSLYYFSRTHTRSLARRYKHPPHPQHPQCH